jgi:hypothetical protein
MAMTSGAMMSGGVRRKRPHKVICGVPDANCSGSSTAASNGIRHGGQRKMHGSHEEAFKCYAKYLLSQGYKQIGSREFAPPDGGPIMLLTKKSKFGSTCRGGKGDRQMPVMMVGGTITST